MSGRRKAEIWVNGVYKGVGGYIREFLAERGDAAMVNKAVILEEMLKLGVVNGHQAKATVYSTLSNLARRGRLHRFHDLYGITKNRQPEKTMEEGSTTKSPQARRPK
jgi:hypothetical protein